MKKFLKKTGPVLLGGLLLVTILGIFSPLRYKITGTNEGYIYKTDRLTGKTWIVTPKGELEIGEYKKPSPSPQAQAFPLNNLVILSLKNRNFGNSSYGDVIVKNTFSETASKLKYKITYSKTENGEAYDTEYVNGFNEILAGDTITESLLLKPQTSQYWYNVYIISAEY